MLRPQAFKLKLDKIQLAFCILYTISFGLMLLNGGMFWDDWTIPSEWKQLEWRYLQNKQYFGFLHYFFQISSNPILFYRIATFLLYFFSTIFLFRFVNIANFEKKQVFKLIILLAAIIPFNAARITMICFPYAAGNFLFFFGIWLIAIWIYEEKQWLRPIILLSFLLSFIVQSFIVAYVVPLAFILLKKTSLLKSQKLTFQTVKESLKYSDFIFLPIFFKIIISLIPVNDMYGGLYLNYNKIGLRSILYFIPNVLLGFVKNFLGCFVEYYFFLTDNLFIVFILSFVLYNISYILVFRRENYYINSSQRRLKLLTPFRFSNLSSSTIICFWIDLDFLTKSLILGSILFLIGLAPYLLVGKMPSFEGYETRHQLLLPYGLGILIFVIISLLSRTPRIQTITFLVMITVFVSTNISYNLQYLKGWLKQESIVLNLKNNLTIIEHKTFIVFDKSEEINATERDFAFYNLNGLAKKAFGEETRLFCEYEEFKRNERYGWGKLLESAPKFNMTNYNLSLPTHVITLDNGANQLSIIDVMKLLFEKKFHKKLYETNLVDIVTLDVEEFDNETIDFFLKNE